MVNRVGDRLESEAHESPPPRDGRTEARKFVATIVGMAACAGTVGFVWWLLWYLAAHAVGTAL